MTEKQKMAYWRLIMAFLVYAVIWMGYKAWVPYWAGAFLLPLATLLRPHSNEAMASWPAVQEAGLFFYVVKWFAVILGLLAAGFLLGAVALNVPLTRLPQVAMREGLVLVPLLFIPICSYLNYAKHHVNDQMRRARQARTAGRKKKKTGKRR